MTLPDLSHLEFLQPGNPFRPWAIALGACLAACVPASTRRMGGILLFVLAAVGTIAFFVDDALRTFTPSS